MGEANQNKKSAPEVLVQEQLNKQDLECIYRHLNMFIQINWRKKQNLPDACVGCKRYCTRDSRALDPWPAFYKLADVVKSTKFQ